MATAATIRVRLALLFLGLGWLACGEPSFFVVAGGELAGTVDKQPVGDWGFTDAVDIVQLETRPDEPYSIHIYGVGSGGVFYIASQGWRLGVGSGSDARWVAHIADDPRVRLRVAETLYELEAARVENEVELARVQTLYHQKYGTEADEWGFWRTEESPWVYRLAPR